MPRIRSAHLAAAALSLLATEAAAQSSFLSTTSPSVALSAVKNSSLTVTITSGGTLAVSTVADSTANDFGTVNVTTAWDLNLGASNVNLVGYFATPSQAMASGSNYIASSLIKASVNGGSFTPFTGNAVGSTGTTGGSVTLFTQSISSSNRVATRSDAIALRLDLTNQFVLTPGTYSGTLNLRAITQ